MFPAPQPPTQRAPEPQAAQQPPQAPPGGGSMFPAGQQSPTPQQVMESYVKSISQLEENASQIMQIQAVIDPEGQALLVPIAQAGKALKARLQEIAQRMQAGPGSPGGANASGGGTPAPNPAEGATPAAMAA